MRCSRPFASHLGLVTSLGLVACGEPPLGPVPATLVLTASDTITTTGGRVTLTVRAVDSSGAPVPAWPIRWSVADTAHGQVTAGGFFTAREPGRTYVRARLDVPSLAESLAVRIVPPGTVKWTWAAAEVGGYMPLLGGPALGTDGTVYVLVGTGGFPDFPGVLVALTPSGGVKWTQPLLQVEGSTGLVVTPGTERVWVVGKAAYLLTAATGEVLWDTLAAPEVGPDFLSGAATPELLVAAWGKHVVAFRAADQAVLWTSQEAPFISWLVPPTITAEGQVLAKRTADTLFLFRGTDGQVLRFFLDPDTAADKRVFGVGTVPVADRYYLPTVSRLAAYNTSGPLDWLTEVTGRGVSEPAVGPDGSLYIQARTYGLARLNPNGTLRWKQFQVQPRWPWLGGVALAKGGTLYAAGIEAFWAFDTDSNPLWKHVADSGGRAQAFVGAPAVALDGTVHTFTSTHVYAFWASAPPEPNSPWPMWRHDAQRTGWAR